LDGYAATRQIRAAEHGARTVIIAITASAFRPDQQATRDAGCDDYLAKPFRVEAIYAKLARHLGVKFVYAEPPLATSASAAAELPSGEAPLASQTLADGLAQLPEPQREKLRQAVLAGKLREAQAQVEQVRAAHGALAGQLDELLRGFHLQEILEALAPGEQRTP
jgi:CheY-like chemotaxis protein